MFCTSCGYFYLHIPIHMTASGIPDGGGWKVKGHLSHADAENIINEVSNSPSLEIVC